MGVGLTGSCAIACKTSATRAAETESRPEVGSSRSKTSGLEMSSNPMLTLRISPPLMPLALPPVTSPILESLMAEIPNISSKTLTRSCFSLSVTLSGKRRRAAKSSASKTVKVAGRMSCCGTNPTRGDFLPSAAPARMLKSPETTPDLLFPAKISTRVVFPAPDKNELAKYSARV